MQRPGGPSVQVCSLVCSSLPPPILALTFPRDGVGTHLEVIPVLGPAPGGGGSRVPQQRLPHSPLRVLLQEPAHLLRLGQELLLQLQPCELRLLLQPAGLLQYTGLLEGWGREREELRCVPALDRQDQDMACPAQGQEGWGRARKRGPLGLQNPAQWMSEVSVEGTSNPRHLVSINCMPRVITYTSTSSSFLNTVSLNC